MAWMLKTIPVIQFLQHPEKGMIMSLEAVLEKESKDTKVVKCISCERIRVGAKLQDRHVRLLLRKPAESVSEVLHRGCGYLGAEADCAYSPIPRPAGFAGFTRRA